MARIVRFHQTGGPEVLNIDHVNVPRRGIGDATGGLGWPR